MIFYFFAPYPVIPLKQKKYYKLVVCSASRRILAWQRENLWFNKKSGSQVFRTGLVKKAGSKAPAGHRPLAGFVLIRSLRFIFSDRRCPAFQKSVQIPLQKMKPLVLLVVSNF